MPRDLLAETITTETESQDREPVDLLSSQLEEQAPTISEGPVRTQNVFLSDIGQVVEHPADMSHDQVNDAIQLEVYGRPRHKSYIPDLSTTTKLATDLFIGGIPAMASNLAAQEPKALGETAKGFIRGAEVIPKGIGGMMQWFGENLEDQAKLNDPQYQTNLATSVGKAFDDWGTNVVNFYQTRQKEGFEAPDPELFRGTYLSNPSFARAAATVAEGIPALAAASLLTISTGNPVPGIALLGLTGGGEAYSHARSDEGKEPSSVKRASGIFVASTIGNSLFMSLPLGKLVGGRLPASRMAAAVEEAATFAGVTLPMVPFNNIIAMIGGDKSRELFEGMTESLLSAAITGGLMGAMRPGRAIQIDRMIQEAHKAGVAAKDIDGARTIIAQSMRENPEIVLDVIKSEGESARASASIPKFKDTIEAVEHGKSIIGDSEQIQILKDELVRIQPMIDKALKENDLQNGMDLAVRKQFLNEAIRVAEGGEPVPSDINIKLESESQPMDVDLETGKPVPTSKEELSLAKITPEPQKVRVSKPEKNISDTKIIEGRLRENLAEQDQIVKDIDAAARERDLMEKAGRPTKAIDNKIDKLIERYDALDAEAGDIMTSRAEDVALGREAIQLSADEIRGIESRSKREGARIEREKLKQQFAKTIEKVKERAADQALERQIRTELDKIYVNEKNKSRIEELKASIFENVGFFLRR